MAKKTSKKAEKAKKWVQDKAAIVKVTQVLANMDSLEKQIKDVLGIPDTAGWCEINAKTRHKMTSSQAKALNEAYRELNKIQKTVLGISNQIKVYRPE